MSKGNRLARRKGQGALRLFLEKVGERGVAYTAPHYQGCAVTVVFSNTGGNMKRRILDYTSNVTLYLKN